jgi:hypothetical protein
MLPGYRFLNFGAFSSIKSFCMVRLETVAAFLQEENDLILNWMDESMRIDRKLESRPNINSAESTLLHEINATINLRQNRKNYDHSN